MDQPTYTKDEVLQLVANVTDLTSRSMLSKLAGQQFGGDRDIDANLGYNTSPSIEDFAAYYSRRGLAATIVDAPAQTTWRRRPTIDDGSEGQSEFCRAWVELEHRLRAFHCLERVDRLAGIGHFGVLVLGFVDSGDLATKVERVTAPNSVVYLAPYAEGAATVKQLDENPESPRFGRPEVYSIKMVSKQGARDVHWSRVLHVAEGKLGDEVHGEPRLQKVFNYLEDLDKIVGSSAEAYWQAVVKKLVVSNREGWELGPDALDDAKDEVQALVHNLQRYMVAEGITVDELGSSPADPTAPFKVVIQLISGTTGIPQRVLLGSERGDLASSQDEANWLGRIAERQEQFAEPEVLRRFIDMLLGLGALPQPKNGVYTVSWPRLFYLTDAEQAEVHLKTAQAMQAVSGGYPGELFSESERRVAVGAPAQQEEDLIVANALETIDPDDPEVKAVFEKLRRLRARRR